MKLHQYKAKCLRVIDGDTCDCLIDIGFKIFIKERIRFYGINTPESRTRDKAEKKRGLEVKEFVRIAIEGTDILLETHKQGKFGRYLGTIYYGEENFNLNKELVDKGMAVSYFGGKR